MQEDSWNKERLTQWFRETVPFSTLPPEAHEELLDVAVECEYQPGEVIMQQRSTQHPFMGGVLDGEVRLFEDVTHLLEVPCLPGGLFGASGIFKGGPLPYHVIASLPSTCVRIPAYIVHELSERHQAFADYFAANFWDVPDLHGVGMWESGNQGRLFGVIASMEGSESWGDVLAMGFADAGVSWLRAQPTDGWTMLSPTDAIRDKQQQVHGEDLREGDVFATSHWTEPDFLDGESFDLVLADYRNGAVDIMAPRLQLPLLSKLRQHTRRRLFLTGHEPIDHESEDQGGQIIQAVMRLRDVCLTLAYHHPFLTLSSHEARHALQEAGFVIDGLTSFPRQFSITTIHAMLNECLLALPSVPDSQLALALAASIRDLRERALAFKDFQWGVRYSADYLIAARPV